MENPFYEGEYSAGPESATELRATGSRGGPGQPYTVWSRHQGGGSHRAIT